MRGNISKNKNGQGEMIQTLPFVELDSLKGHNNVGFYKIIARTMLGSTQSVEYMIVTFNDSDASTTQYYFFNDGRVQFRNFVGGWSSWESIGVTSYNDLTDKPSLSDVATSGKYEDLQNAPITLLSDYPRTDTQLNELVHGLYYHSSDRWTEYSPLLVFATNTEKWLRTDDEVDYKQEQWTQIIVTDTGIRKRQKTEYRNFSDGRENYTIDWADVPISDDLATKEYVDTAIGNIKTSLENIIEKYDLGGDSV